MIMSRRPLNQLCDAEAWQQRVRSVMPTLVEQSVLLPYAIAIFQRIEQLIAAGRIGAVRTGPPRTAREARVVSLVRDMVVALGAEVIMRTPHLWQKVMEHPFVARGTLASFMYCTQSHWDWAVRLV